MDSVLVDFERSLDERAKAALRELPEDVATNLLRDCQSRSVRNPSAYVFVAARKARPSQLTDTIERLQGDLDDKAIAQLRELPADQSMRILDELAQNWDQVRNPSAYVSTAVKNFHTNHPNIKAGVVGGAAGMMMGAPMDPAMAAMMGQQMGFGVMGGMGAPPPAGTPASCQMPLGPMMGPGMAPPMVPPAGTPAVAGMGGPMGAAMSAPMGMAHMLQGMPMGSPMATMGAPGPMGPLGFGGCCGAPFGLPFGMPVSQKQIEQELEAAISRLGLDEIANEALHRVPLEIAREILQALDGGVRNPSAFVMSKIRSIHPSAGGSRASAPSGLGGLGGLGGLPPMLPGEAVRRPESKADMLRGNELMLEKFQTDERAKSIAREIPPEALFDIFTQLSSHMREIRNPSAFIFQACVNFQKQHPQPTGYPSYPPQQPFVTRPGATGEQVDEAIQRLDLDAAAAGDMRALPPETAMGILDQITEGVKNKSAFATTAARRITGRPRSRSRSRSQSRRHASEVPRRSRGRGHSRERSRSRDRAQPDRSRALSRAEALEVVEGLIKRCDLDEQASRAMRSLHVDDAMKIMEDIQRNSEVRNASAFAYTAAKKLLGNFNPEEAQRKFDLDETALTCLNAILPSEAKEIMESIDDGLRNPSAFVTAQVRRLHPELPALSGARSTDAPSTSGGRTLRSSFPPGMSRREMEDEVESIIRSMNLDERANGVLHEVPLEKAMDILGELRRNWTNVRNPSAYVFNACVKEINQPGRSAGLGGVDAAGVAFPPPPPGMPPGMPGMPGVMPGMPGFPGPPFGMPGPPPGMPGFSQGMPGPMMGMPGQPLGIPQGMSSSGMSGSPGGLPAPSSPRESAARKAEVQRAIEKWNLDETALGALLQIPPDQALEILNSLDTGVRNPSAFVTTAARKRLDASGGGSAATGGSFGMGSEDAVDFRRTLQEQVDNLIRKSDLDEKATHLLHELPLEGALEILGELQRKRDQIRNPSAYVFNAGVKFQDKMAHGRQPAANPAALLAQRVESLADHFRLDGHALGALRSISLEAALGILDRMSEGISGDPSEHVRRAVDAMHQHTRGLAGPAMPMDAFGNEQALAQKAEFMARDLGVDENSLAALQTVPLEHAVHFLNRLADSRTSIRNPSAFIISAVKDFRAQHPAGPGGSPAPSPHVGGSSGVEMDQVAVGRQLDASIQRLGLDRTAVEALRALPGDEALALVSSVDSNVRNPSAWVTNAARNALTRLTGLPGEAGEPQHRYSDASPPRPSQASEPSMPSPSQLPPVPPVPPVPPMPPAPPPVPSRAPSPARDPSPSPARAASPARDSSPARAPRAPPPPPPPPPRPSSASALSESGGDSREGAEDPVKGRPWARWDLPTWLSDVGEGTGALDEYSTVLSRNLESPAQIVEIYCTKAANGSYELEESFFRDVGVEDTGHQQLFHRWIERHLNN